VNLVAGSSVTTDGLACFSGVAEAGMKHTAIITRGGRPSEPEFKWVNSGLGNIKTAITGTCRSCDPQHTARYLAAYEYRFNRRLELNKMVERLAAVATQTTPRPYKTIIKAETSG
jgi:ISXO2-like transposase domain